MNNLNLTFNVLDTKGNITQKTFYSINAISKTSNPDHCIVHSGGEKDVCVISFSEMWNKLNKVNNESTSR